MFWHRCAMMPLVLILCGNANAQVHHGQSPHHNTAPAHGGGVHPGHPQQGHGMMQEHQMWNQYYQEQLYLNQIMGGSRGTRHHSQASAGRSASSHAGQNQSAQAQPSGKPGSANHERGKNGSSHPDAAKKAEHKAVHEAHKPQARTAKKNTTQRAAMSDQSIISLLRTTHRRLESADHDYDGHRMKAMQHIAGALQDLGSTSVTRTTPIFNSGNLPQSRSDEILRDAMIHLRNTESSLGNGTGTERTDRHHRARSAVTHAIGELETALRIR